MFVSVVALISRILSNPIANFYQKKLTVMESSLTVNFWSYFFMAILCLPFIKNNQILGYSGDFYLYVILAGLLCFLGTICLIKALSIGELSVLGPINSYKSIIGLIVAFFILGEIPNIKSLTGFFLIIGASFLFVDEKGKFILNKSVLLRMLALVFTGVEAVILKQIILMSSPTVSFFWWAFTGLIFSFLFAFINKKLKPNSIKTVQTCFIIGVLLSIMQLSTNYVFENFNVGLSLALFQLSSVVSLFLGFKFLNEKGILRKTTGTIIMIIGSILILLK